MSIEFPLRKEVEGIKVDLSSTQGDLSSLQVNVSNLDGRLTSTESTTQNQEERLAEVENSYVTSTEVSTMISSGTEGIYALESEFELHKNTDISRWQDLNDLKTQFYDLKASVQNKTLDTANQVDIERQAQGDGYTVTSTLGGRVNFTAVIVLISVIPIQVFVNDTLVWNSQGLGIGTITDSVEVENGDIVTCTGITSIKFTPYISS